MPEGLWLALQSLERHRRGPRGGRRCLSLSLSISLYTSTSPTPLAPQVALSKWQHSLIRLNIGRNDSLLLWICYCPRGGARDNLTNPAETCSLALPTECPLRSREIVLACPGPCSALQMFCNSHPGSWQSEDSLQLFWLLCAGSCRAELRGAQHEARCEDVRSFKILNAAEREVQPRPRPRQGVEA